MRRKIQNSSLLNKCSLQVRHDINHKKKQKAKLNFCWTSQYFNPGSISLPTWTELNVKRTKIKFAVKENTYSLRVRISIMALRMAMNQAILDALCQNLHS